MAEKIDGSKGNQKTRRGLYDRKLSLTHQTSEVLEYMYTILAVLDGWIGAGNQTRIQTQAQEHQHATSTSFIDIHLFLLIQVRAGKTDYPVTKHATSMPPFFILYQEGEVPSKGIMSLTSSCHIPQIPTDRGHVRQESSQPSRDGRTLKPTTLGMGVPTTFAQGQDPDSTASS
ncbi:uncharacterized protein PGTG_17796 [Puccinia graminis f. sp. tritici CRL 75-36-700-3]|uniref:Uncharacterized protein n=2 Tax=Puccinia graminis f. sp. tritici TaxID=56615 RepID=E3L5H1_PUCGT|nr:uncharacterized protein PGTG_17796 [Puccinia graminis f. sp. tritici CRL 75-36-700-3]EFP91796.2 hypothetical protein PGTG_17796 [Puccinia graminis f. sp. tritici CRL 75-36-700-3]